jgi:holo-[acyl-carrier protein] synthase
VGGKWRSMWENVFEAFGIGTDIEDVQRFENLSDRSFVAFLKKNFTKNELNYCLSKDAPAPHLAARYAGKEAVIKALFSLNITHIFYPAIEIVNNERGVPNVRINTDGNEKIHIKLSLSHSSGMALAFCIVNVEA